MVANQQATPINITGHPLELLKDRFVNCLHGNELDRKHNEEETVQMEAAQTGDDEVQHRSEIDVVKAELATA